MPAADAEILSVRKDVRFKGHMCWKPKFRGNIKTSIPGRERINVLSYYVAGKERNTKKVEIGPIGKNVYVSEGIQEI